MQFRFLIMILFSELTLVHPFIVAQQLQPSGPAAPIAAPAPVPETKVAPDAAVITMHGLCGSVFLPGNSPEMSGTRSPGDASANGQAPLTSPDPKCETIVTRAQFETLVKAISPRSAPQMARSFAVGYPETLMFARKAVESGLDKDPVIVALLQYRYQQALYSIFKNHVKQKANDMSDAELRKFYDDNRTRYEEFGLLRIHIPNTKQHNPTPGTSTQPKVDTAADEAAMKALAIRIRAQAVAGGDFERLQAKAYRLAGVEDPPDTDLGDKWTRDSFPAEYQAEVFSLKPGQVSQPIHNGSGWHVIKLVSRKMIPWSEARDTTLGYIVADEANSLRKAITTEINDQYFVTTGSGEGVGPLK